MHIVIRMPRNRNSILLLAHQESVLTLCNEVAMIFRLLRVNVILIFYGFAALDLTITLNLYVRFFTKNR